MPLSCIMQASRPPSGAAALHALQITLKHQSILNDALTEAGFSDLVSQSLDSPQLPELTGASAPRPVFVDEHLHDLRQRLTNATNEITGLQQQLAASRADADAARHSMEQVIAAAAASKQDAIDAEQAASARKEAGLKSVIDGLTLQISDLQSSLTSSSADNAASLVWPACCCRCYFSATIITFVFYRNNVA